MNKVFNGLLVFARIFVGSLFIVSGMIKANDPTGFSYKMEEYFSEDALGWTFFEPYALPIAALICIAEIVLGFAVLFGGKPKLMAWSLLLMILFFTGLTFYTATCDPQATYTVVENGVELQKRVQCVTDCGCFGDALKGTIGRSLTPWESFYKDVILFFFIGIIFMGKNRIRMNSAKDDALILVSSTVFLLLFSGYFFQWMFPVYFSVACFGVYLILKKRHFAWLGPDWTIALAMTIFSTGFSVYTTMYLPVKDFTAYAVGTNIREKMSDGIPAIYETKLTYTNLKTGEDKTFAVNDPEWQDETKWKWKATDNVMIKEGKLASISSFNPMRDYESMTATELADTAIQRMIAKDIDKYYQRFMAIRSIEYDAVDTISPQDYDPAMYPDSSYEVLGTSQKLLDPSNHMQVDFQSYILGSEKILLFTMLHAKDCNTGAIEDMKNLQAEARKAGIPVFVLTASGQDELNAFEKANQLGATYLFMDETELKIVVRSNPGLITLRKGIITGKWAGRSLPNWKALQEKL